MSELFSKNIDLVVVYFNVAASLITVSFVSSEVPLTHYKQRGACTSDEPQTVVMKNSKLPRFPVLYLVRCWIVILKMCFKSDGL